MKPWKKIFLLVAGVGLVGAFLFIRFRVFAGSRSTRVWDIFQNPDRSQGELLTAAVARHMDVPKDIPSVVQVIDPETLRKTNPAFYGQVAFGDWVLTYQRLVVLYRPVGDRVIAAQPIVQKD